MVGRWYITQLPHYPELGPKLGSVLMPRVEGREPTSRAVCRGAGVNVRTPRREAALRFIEYLASPEYSELIVADGDALPPSPELASDGEALAIPLQPEPAFHQTFIDAVERAGSLDNSPYIDAQVVQRWLIERIESVENQLETPEDAMRSYAAEIDQRIARNIRRGAVGR
jgi:ABC-type glycerol-3-phosphate transport system substrate-binding protein